jgi:hypothetical protein
MENELLGVNIPEGYLSIVSKYWHYAEEDIMNCLENGESNGEKQSE